MNVVSRGGDEFCVRAVHMLADDVVAVVQTWVQNDALVCLDSLDAFAEFGHGSSAVGPEDPWLRDRRHALADPDV